MLRRILRLRTEKDVEAAHTATAQQVAGSREVLRENRNVLDDIYRMDRAIRKP